MGNHAPVLARRRRGPIEVLTDPGASDEGWLIAFTDRRGGISAHPYDSLNVSGRVGDDPTSVTTNRATIGDALSFEPDRLVMSDQVHGAEMIEVAAGDSGVMGAGDVLVVRGAGPVAAILTADCAPVAVAGTEGLALAHAGWRGLVAGAVERAAEAVGRPVAAWVGPCIHACCYEVGPDVVEAFRDRGLPISAPGRVDPAEAAGSILRGRGVQQVAVASECTACDDRYFSYRRDGVTGRQAAIVSLLDRR